MTNDYEIGYGKPPKKYQFKPGCSGNKKGRPKGSPNMNTLVDKVLKEKVKIVMNGKTKKVSVMEGILCLLARDSMNGNVKAQKVLLDLCKNLSEKQEELSLRNQFLKQDDLELLADYGKELSKGEPINE